MYARGYSLSARRSHREMRHSHPHHYSHLETNRQNPFISSAHNRTLLFFGQSLSAVLPFCYHHQFSPLLPEHMKLSFPLITLGLSSLSYLLFLSPLFTLSLSPLSL